MLRGLLKAKNDEQQALVKAAIDAGRGMNEDEDAKFKALQTEIESLENTVKAAKEVEERQEKLNAPVNTPAFAQPKAPEEKNKFASFGEQMAAVYQAGKPENAGRVDQRLFNAASGMSESVPSDGGFLVQQEFSQTILERAYSTGEILNKISAIPIGAGKNGLKTPCVDESSRANGSRFGGIRAYWEGEADQITGSKAKFGLLDLSLKKLTALVYCTDDLLEDAIALEAWLMQKVPLEINFKVEDAIINGSGAGQPLGILNGGALVPVAKETGQVADTIVFENVNKMWSRCWAPSRKNAVWLINQDCEPQLNGMSIAVGTGGIPVYLPAGGLSQSPYSTLFGRPVIPVEYCATVGDQGDIILADFTQYQAIDKGVLKTATSIHVRFDYNETAFRFVFRFDGQPSWKSALTPYKGSNTLSPFVALANRA
ncbi:MAG: phage major capsid protein [Bacteroidales bacterium]|nr:phage major capsid protein [Bacteroidales bacterium]